MNKTSLLIVEDEDAIRDLLRFTLEPAGFTIIEAANIAQADHHIANKLPDLILLDWMLPDMAGIDYVRCLKKQVTMREIPIVMLTARAEENNKLTGFEVGVDDYITKPFSPKELVARIKTILRRSPLLTVDGYIQVHSLALNINTQEVTIKDQLLGLTPIEYRLLHFLLTHQNRIYSRGQLLDQVWGDDKYVDERTVDVHIRRLRKHLEPSKYHVCICTVRGSGYQFSAEKLCSPTLKN